jgi:hypothetical protein
MPQGKGVDFNGGGEPQHPGHFRGAGFLGIDGHAETQVVLNEVQLLHVHGVAHPGDGVPRPQLLADKAAQQVQLIRAGTGDDEIRLIRPGFQLNIPGSAVALHDHHVQFIVGLIQSDPGTVYQRHLVLFPGQLLRQNAADFSVADNHDFHKVHLHIYPFCPTISQIPIECNRAWKSVQNLKGRRKNCHFLHVLPEIHANTPNVSGKAMVAEQNREKAKRRENGMKSNNQINIPQARDAMDKFKMQAASELDVPVTY